MTSRAPAWLSVEGSPAAFVLVEERAAIVRRVFEETVAGYGKHSIARRLNQEGVATFGRAAGWHASYIQKMLNSPAVLGEMQPGRKPRGGAREIVGDAIVDYYPPVIDADLHARAHRSMAGRSRRVAGKGRKLVNVFSGLAECGACGERMTFRGKGEKVRANGDKVNEDYLVCDSYQRGRGCKNGQHYNYTAWQRAILDAVLIKALGDEHFASRQEVRELEVGLAETSRRRDAAARKGEAALALYLETERKEARDAWTSLTAEVDDCDAALSVMRKRIVTARGAVSPEEHRKRIFDVHERMTDHDDDVRFEARSRVMEAVHALVDTVAFSAGPMVVVTTRAGQSTAIEPDEDGGAGLFHYRFDAGFLD